MRLVRIKTRDVFKQGVGSGWYPATQGEVYVVVINPRDDATSRALFVSPDGVAFWSSTAEFRTW